MTPRVKVSALQSSATAEDVVNLTRATGLSRFPVYRERIDEIVGMVHLKDALAIPAHDRLHTPVGRIAKAPLLVPESLPVQPLLARLRSEQPIAVVVDEYGGTAGVVTLEDIVEELVGEVRDEHDRHERPELAAAPPEDGRLAWDADGSCRVDVLQRIGLDVPEVRVGEAGAVHHRQAQVGLAQARARQVQPARLQPRQIRLEQVAARATGAAPNPRDLPGVLGRSGRGRFTLPRAGADEHTEADDESEIAVDHGGTPV